MIVAVAENQTVAVAEDQRAATNNDIINWETNGDNILWVRNRQTLPFNNCELYIKLEGICSSMVVKFIASHVIVLCCVVHFRFFMLYEVDFRMCTY